MYINQLTEFFQHLEQQLHPELKEMRRLFHGRGRCWPGLEQLTADWLSQQLVVSLFKAADDDFMHQLRQGLHQFAQSSCWERCGGKSIVLQHRYAQGTPAEVLWGTLTPRPVATEDGLNYQLDIGRNQNCGLFLDMRYGRRWVREQSAGKKVLNLFAYTCGFSVAAVAGGATQVVNLDMAKSSLAKGRENHLLNQHDISSVHFLAHDLLKSWGKIKKYGPYDLVIIDPPTFQKGSFALTKDYRKILRRLDEWLSKDGQVLACVNSPAVPSDFLIQAMQDEAPVFTLNQRLDNPPEFADVDPEASLKALVFHRLA
ncbi:class I SAM-dependent methyltransferase [Vibrio mangrovi]|uniref:Class I SAM-dependent methyltransferase n=1 Tax=Vibrio mangrovi TaxID=474394 RepID=A0A1Y6INY1_9VIBR|nr:class I SAM-dependent methyltransferase [Vibrio mangrovi]MDW6003839.1 class I SAM-dependent methyltransferase [Vibrio mangrovi]SMR99366.1 Ribosomal RNA large subunit methyltransferase I [Vibrio mangrovi]